MIYVVDGILHDESVCRPGKWCGTSACVPYDDLFVYYISTIYSVVVK